MVITAVSVRGVLVAVGSGGRACAAGGTSLNGSATVGPPTAAVGMAKRTVSGGGTVGWRGVAVPGGVCVGK